MFAGPNGSGKSTLKSVLPGVLLGVYLNPDEIEQEIRQQGFLGVSQYGVKTTEAEVIGFFRSSVFLTSIGEDRAVKQLGFANGRLSFAGSRGSTSGFDVGLWVKNVADRHYLQYAINQQDPEGFDYGLVGEPRTYGMDVRYRF